MDFEEYRMALDPPRALCRALSNIKSCVNLQTLNLNFAADCGAPDSDLWEGPETYFFRSEVMSALFSAFNTKTDLPKFHQLRIKNFQDVLPAHIGQDVATTNLLGKLDSLSLRIASETHDAAPELEEEMEAFHSFFNTHLKAQILLPVASHLKELKLYTIHLIWGVFPASNFQDIHFPLLEKLALGNYAFGYEHQIEWITSHKATLQTLVLDNCEITIDDKNHDEDYRIQWSNDGRWHKVFNKFQSELTELRHFAITANVAKCYGNGATYFDEDFDSVVSGTLNKCRYAGYMESKIEGEYTDDDIEEMAQGVDDPEYLRGWPPKCLEEDSDALAELLEVVRKRRVADSSE